MRLLALNRDPNRTVIKWRLSVKPTYTFSIPVGLIEWYLDVVFGESFIFPICNFLWPKLFYKKYMVVLLSYCNFVLITLIILAGTLWVYWSSYFSPSVIFPMIGLTIRKLKDNTSSIEPVLESHVESARSAFIVSSSQRPPAVKSSSYVNCVWRQTFPVLLCQVWRKSMISICSSFSTYLVLLLKIFFVEVRLSERFVPS